MALTKEKKLKLLQIEKARFILDSELDNDFITEQDIIDLLSVNSNYGIKSNNIKYSYKQSLLKSIFNSPFVLCDQNKVSISVKKILPLFLNCRYEMEIEQLNYLKQNGYFNEEEYQKEKDLIKFCYYESSIDGKNILKTGHVVGVLDNKIKVR